MSDAEAMAFLAGMSEAPLFPRGGWVQLGIAEADADQLMGDIGILVSADGLTGEIGFTLAPDAQGRGVATAAVSQALQLLFGATRVSQVLGVTDSRNIASVRLLERVGFRRRESRSTVFRGEPCIEEVYVLSRTHWPATGIGDIGQSVSEREPD
jgi:aminoglycoside 6'-N-acetyltransferase